MRKLILLVLALLASPAIAMTPLTQSQPFKTAVEAAIAPALSYTDPDPAAVTRTRDAKNGDLVSVLDFCPATSVNGSTDLAPCIQQAVTVLCARPLGGGVLYFPPGNYAVSTVTVACSGITLQGAGRGDRDRNNTATRITALASGVGNPVFLFRVTCCGNANASSGQPSGSSSYSYGAVVRDMGFWADGVRQGPMVRMDHVQGGLVDNVYAWNPYNFVKFFGGFGVRVTDSLVDQISGGWAVECEGQDNGGKDRLDVCEIDHTLVSQVNSVTQGGCYHVKDFVNTVWLRSTTCEVSSYALLSECPTLASASNCPAFFTLDDFEAEGFGPTVRDLVTFRDTHLVKWNGGFVGTYDGQGGVNNVISMKSVRFVGSNGGFDLQGVQVYGSKGSCIYTHAVDTKVLGGQIYGCGSGGSIPFFGIEVGQDVVNGVSAPAGMLNVQAVAFCKRADGVAAGGNMSPVAFQSGTQANVVMGSIFRECSGKSVVDNSGATNNITSPNVAN